MAGTLHFFAKLKEKRPGSSYSSQIRLTILLLLLFLVILNLQITYLFEQTKRSLNLELETRLKLAASILQEYWEKRDYGRKSIQSRKGILTEEDIFFLKGWAIKSGLDRLLWIQRGGRPLEIEAEGRGLNASDPILARGSEGIMEQAWRGDLVAGPLYRDSGGGFYKALLVPLQRSGEGVVALVGAIAPANGLGHLSRFSSFILYGFLIGIPAALAISFFFIEFVLSPYRRLSSATPSLSETSNIPPDVETIVSTYENAILTLREKEQELASLYQREQKRASDLESYQRYLLSSISSGVLSVDSAFRIQVCNEVARGILAPFESQLQGKDVRQAFKDMPELGSLLEETLQEGKIYRRRELQIRREGSGWSWIGISSSTLRDETGAIRGAIFLLTDLTESRELEEQMRIRENLASLGEISAGIAHEFRNSLSVLLGQCRLLQRRLPEDTREKRTLEEMAAEILSLEAIIREFLKFARPQELSIQPLNLAEFLKDLEGSFSEQLAEAYIELIIRPGQGGFVYADPLALKQAFVNLIQNSKEAMPQGGRIAVGIKTPKTGHEMAGVTGLPQEGFVRVSLSDSGKGMEEEEKEKAFLPFFTTKERGTGLGLALVQKAIVGMGGKVEVESEPGSGTTFHLYLPLVPAAKERGSG